MIPLAKPQRRPSGASRRRMLFLLPVLPVVFLGAWMTIPTSRDGIITVCPAGQPDCDFATIQAGIDDANAGDTVLVYTGVYTEHVTLKNDVTLTSNDGPDVTTITANQAPVVSGEDVVSATLRGFSITGRDPITTLVGIELVDSSLVISNTIIRDLHGMDAGATQPNGQDAIGIRVTGNSELIVSRSSIQDISGGNRPAEPDGLAGSAAGIWMEGEGRVVVTSTALRRVMGGNTGGGNLGVGWCGNGTAGWAVGIHAEGRIDLEVNQAEITDLVGGIPCSPFGVFCRGPAGSVRGIEAFDGTVALRNSTLARFSSTTSYGIQPSYAVVTSNSRRTTLEANTITSLSNLVWERPAGQLRGDLSSPYCPAPGGSEVAAVAAVGDDRLTVVDNVISDLVGSGAGGRTFGVLARDVGDVTVSRTSIVDIDVGENWGELLGNPAGGIVIEHTDTADVRANTLHEIHGGAAWLERDGSWDGPGDSVGIELNGVTEATVVNNSLRLLEGGAVIEGGGWLPGFGGDAIALLVSGNLVRIQNNTCFQTLPGLSTDPRGGPGIAIGVRVLSGADVSVLNNALVSQGIGISSVPAAAPIAGHNALWDNETDYVGVPPGAGDLHVAPAFVDPEHGDLHLSPRSPLIDAGTNVGVPAEDWEGDPRPVDGAGDRIALADIGADEYWPGLRYSDKGVDRVSARPGDTLTYRLRLVNPASRSNLPGVVLTDTLSTLTGYVPGSLWASTGSWGYASGVITWTGTLPAGGNVLVSYSAVITEALTGPQAVVNEALLDDPFGPPQAIWAVTLVNPVERFFPWVGKR